MVQYPFPQQNQQQTEMKKTISYSSPILNIYSSSFEGSEGLLLVATEASIHAELILIPSANRLADGVDRKVLYTYPVGSKVTALALSPSTRPVNEQIQFAAAFEDRSLVFYHRGKMVELLTAKTWVNDLAFDSTGTILASVSDDEKVRVWSNLNTDSADVESFCEIVPITHPLRSRPISVQFHKRQATHMLISEISGRVFVMDVQDGTLLTSVIVNNGLDLLRSCVWHPENPLIFGVVTGNTWSLYHFPLDGGNTNGTIIPEHVGESECSGLFSWNPSSPKMFAVPGKSLAGIGSNPSVYIFPNGFTKVPYIFHLPSKSRVTQIAWNPTASVLYVASGLKIHLISC